MQDDTVTLRDRDSMVQERVPIDRLVDEFRRRIDMPLKPLQE
jgi:glycyl-tRNA synthetase (class II)